MNKENSNFQKGNYLPDTEYPLSISAQKTINSLRNIINDINQIDPFFENEEIVETTQKLEKLINNSKSETKLSLRTNGRYRNAISGIFNPVAPPLVSPSGVDVFYVKLNDSYQGIPTLAHGGVISSILDDVIQKTTQKIGQYCLTKEIKITFKKKTPLNTNLTIKGEIVEIDNDKIIILANLFHNETITATAVATMIPLKMDAIKGVSKPNNN